MMVEVILQYLGIGGLAAAVPVIMLFIEIRRDLSKQNKERLVRVTEDTRWRCDMENRIMNVEKDVSRILEIVKNGH